MMPASPIASTWSLDGRTAVHRSAAAGCRLDLDRPATGIVIEPATVDRLLGVELGSIHRATDHWLRTGDVAAVYEPDDARRLRATAMWRLRDWLPGDVLPDDRGLACELVLSAQTSILESDSGLAVVTEFADGRLFHGRPSAAGDDIDWHEADDDGSPVAVLSCGGSPAAAVPACGGSPAAAVPACGGSPAAAVPACGGSPAAAGVTAVLVQRGSPEPHGSIGVVAVHPADAREIVVERRGDRLRITCWLFTGSLEQALEKGVLLRGRIFAAVEPMPAGGIRTALERAAAIVGRFNASPPPLTT